ncbi:MAG TPA: response regulator transcription factor [Thermoanaerobaculia bacterium]|nr:response regulator transcription factor [Thermoanaerobaculia bacterium]
MNIIIADDHAIVRRGLQQIITSRRGWTVAAEASNADELLSVLRSRTFDVLVLDVSLEGRSGVDVLSSVHAEHPRLPVLMLSMYPEEQYALRCLRAGALGYVQKDAEPLDILTAIDKVAAGRMHVSNGVLEQMKSELVRGTAEIPHERLSKREFEVFRSLASGKSVREIAETLNLSPKTVSTYRTRILEKTGLRTNADIVTYAIRNGII